MYYVRELTRQIKEEINAVRRELEHLQKIGLLRSEKRGNRLYYAVRQTYFLYPELSNLVIKSTGIGRLVIKNRQKLGFLKLAFISQKLARSMPRQPDDVDLVFVGKMIMPQVALLVKSIEKMSNTEINYSCMTEEEFTYRKGHKDPFIVKVLLEPRITLVGDDFQVAG